MVTLGGGRRLEDEGTKPDTAGGTERLEDDEIRPELDQTMTGMTAETKRDSDTKSGEYRLIRLKYLPSELSTKEEGEVRARWVAKIIENRENGRMWARGSSPG
ncbi:hypothetical protein BJ165DRAFT_1402981 [Panaeolus papilionaceus]|nr:hypothetical protein BJ165DRAFT_1402981 [Panaeolus papilionaceus]